MRKDGQDEDEIYSHFQARCCVKLVFSSFLFHPRLQRSGLTKINNHSADFWDGAFGLPAKTGALWNFRHIWKGGDRQDKGGVSVQSQVGVVTNQGDASQGWNEQKEEKDGFFLYIQLKGGGACRKRALSQSPLATQYPHGIPIIFATC